MLSVLIIIGITATASTKHEGLPQIIHTVYSPCCSPHPWGKMSCTRIWKKLQWLLSSLLFVQHHLSWYHSTDKNMVKCPRGLHSSGDKSLHWLRWGTAWDGWGFRLRKKDPQVFQIFCQKLTEVIEMGLERDAGNYLQGLWKTHKPNRNMN